MKTGYFRIAIVPRSRVALAVAMALLCLSAVSAQAMTVIVDIGWGYNSLVDMDNATLISDYNLQEGSIVQVIMFNAADVNNYDFETGGADDNFDFAGIYSGPPINGEPTLDASPSTIDVYDPISVPDSHLIVYSTQIGPVVGGNANGQDWYNIYASFQVLGSYDSMYIRVFGASNFLNGTVVASYWGISSLQASGAVLQTWFATFDDVVADQLNYFEVIPEPGSLALISLGGIGLWVARRRRLKRS